MAGLIASVIFVVPGVAISALAGRAAHGSFAAWWNRHSN